MECSITNHSIQRAIERCNCSSEKTAKQRIESAFERGKIFSQFNCKQKKFIEKIENKNNNHCVIYNGFCYVFTDTGTCITILNLPSWFFNKNYFYHKEKIKNIKKFYKYHLNDNIFEI